MSPSTNLQRLAPAASSLPVPSVRPADRRAAKELAVLQRAVQLSVARTQAREIVRTAEVVAESVVATVKSQEVDRVVREAMTGQAMLSKYSAVLAQNDPFLADELKFFSDMARLGKGEIIADLVTDYCRESRR